MYRTLLSLTLFTLLLLGTSPAVGQTTHTVSSGGSIQAAIDGASNGDTIEVEAGTYSGTLQVNKSLTVKGPNAGTPGAGSRGAEAIIEGQVILSADGATLDGFVVEAPDANTTSEAEAVRVSNTPNNVTVQNNIVRDFTDTSTATSFFDIAGINVFGGDGVTAIENVEVSNNKVERIARDEAGAGARGISIQGHVVGATVENNVITDIGQERSAYGFGIVVHGTGNHGEVPTDVTVQNNTIENLLADPTSDFRGVGLGLEVGATADATFENNTVTNAQFLFEDKTNTVNLENAIAANTFDVAVLTDDSSLDADVVFGVLQDAIDASEPAASLSVYEGTYEENINIDKPLTLLAPDGRDVTTIQGSLAGGSFGTVNIADGVNNVQIGGAGAGFTIVGFPLEDAGQEGGAIRFSGASAGSSIIGNELVADGEAALLVLFNRAVEDLTIDGNVIAGQTFEGTPAGSGFSDQFSLLNVPRQLVTVSGGAGVTNVKNITFINNDVVGTAGGINADGDPQGNTLVTIDADGSTITGNTFAGTTTRFGSSLRVRGPDATIENNSFESGGLTPTNAHLFLQNNLLSNALVDANTFDKGVYVEGGEAIGHVIQVGVSATSSGTTLNVLPGTYEESLTIEKSLTLQAAPGASSKPLVIGQSTDAVRVQASGVTIGGLEIQNPEGSGDGVTARNAVGIRVDRDQSNVTIIGNHIQNIATEADTNPIGIIASDGANNLTIENNTIENLQGTTADELQAQAILLIQDAQANPAAIEGAVIRGNTIHNVSDTRSAAGIRFNGDVTGGTIENNTISNLFTDGADGTGFTQAIAFARGGGGNGAPSNVAITGNEISGLEANGTENFAGASHIIFSNDVDAVTISGNEFNAATLDEAYVADGTDTKLFDLAEILSSNTYDPAGEIIEDALGGAFNLIVPTEAGECLPPDLVENRDGIPDGFITVTAKDPEGVVEVGFVDEHGDPALENFEVTTESGDFETSDGINFTLKSGTTAPTQVEFKLTAIPPEDTEPGEDFTAGYFVKVKNGCGSTILNDPIHTLSNSPANELAISGNYPNPFVASTTVEFGLPKAADVRLVVYDVMGRQIATLVDGPMQAGTHEAMWDGTVQNGSAAASGVYILRLQVGDQQTIHRITRIR